MWRCPKCVAHVKDDLAVCPTCRTAAPAEGVAFPSERTADSGDIIPELPAEDEEPLSALIASPAEIPDLSSPWEKRWVEAGFVIGTGAFFLGGLFGLFTDLWFLGLICMLGSPLIGMMSGIGFGTLSVLIEAYWHFVCGSTPRAVPRGADRPFPFWEYHTEGSTDVTTRAVPDELLPSTYRPEQEQPDCPVEVDSPREEVPTSPMRFRILTFWVVLLGTIVAASSLAASESGTAGMLGVGVCFGLPCGLLLASLILCFLPRERQTTKLPAEGEDDPLKHPGREPTTDEAPRSNHPKEPTDAFHTSP